MFKLFFDSLGAFSNFVDSFVVDAALRQHFVDQYFKISSSLNLFMDGPLTPLLTREQGLQ
jgi:hypothetical protein